jgi:hypothetical protein
MKQPKYEALLQCINLKIPYYSMIHSIFMPTLQFTIRSALKHSESAETKLSCKVLHFTIQSALKHFKSLKHVITKL